MYTKWPNHGQRPYSPFNEPNEGPAALPRPPAEVRGLSALKSPPGASGDDRDLQSALRVNNLRVPSAHPGPLPPTGTDPQLAKLDLLAVATELT